MIVSEVVLNRSRSLGIVSGDQGKLGDRLANETCNFQGGELVL